MDEMERRIRESLRARADDVEPTPALWDRVEARLHRQRWLTWTATAAAAAAVVAAAVVVVPGLLSDGPDVRIVGEPTDTAEPTEPADGTPTVEPTDDLTVEPTATETAGPDGDGTVPSHLVVSDGTRIDLVTRDGAVVANLVTLPGEGEAHVVAVEVRPGSTADDLTAVFLAEAEGMVDLRWITVRDGEVHEPQYLPEPYQITRDSVADATSTPVFSPDGRHLAWIEVPRGEPQQPARLRTIGWTDDGPGTGDTADDHADFGLEDLDTTMPVSLEDWLWDEVADDGTATGELRAVGPGGLYHIRIERQGDGALALPADPLRLGSGGEDGAVVDIDDAHVGEAPHPPPSPGVEFQLLARGSGDEDAEGIGFLLLRQPPGGPTEQWPLPELGPTADPWGTWMTAYGESVLVGFGGDAWFVTADGAEQLPGTVVWADAVG